MDATLAAQVDNFLLGQGRVVLDLVDGRQNLARGQQLLEVAFAVLRESAGEIKQEEGTRGHRRAYIAHANGFGLAGLEDGLHLAPGLEVAEVADDVALAVGQFGKAVVGAVGVHQQRPVHEEEVEVVEPEARECLVEPLLDTRGVGGPDFRDDKDVLALNALGKGGLQALADLLLVAVAVGAVDEQVAVGNGVLDGGGDLTGACLPGAWEELENALHSGEMGGRERELTEAQRGHLGAVVEGVCAVRHGEGGDGSEWEKNGRPSEGN